MEMERLTYDEAKAWFWARTYVWFLPAVLVSMISWFIYAGDLVKQFDPRFWMSLAAGVVVVLVGMLAAKITIQLPWMREGWRLSLVLNGPAGAGIAGIAALLICGLIFTYMHNDQRHPPPRDTVNAAYALMQFGIAQAALWGFAFASWFAMRRDRYFVEQL